ncbi:zinc finger MYM-type protein 1-like [Gossypium hirsutum]|uniref:Zinc finger MYM-type protein 1-like n=1 Tax=Gossypium hirsutum TaxID=3635 RepID=A0A1U8HUE3_GOSHI|nr:zinc finger MYM-type protein 1-like [Gossypium hirsutum]
MKSKTIDSFFKKKSTETTQSPSEASQIEVPPSSFVPLNSDARPSKIPRVEDGALDLSNLEREPGLRKQIYEYPVNMRDEIRRAYIKAGPYQPILSEYPASNSKKHPRYFQPLWFKQFSWLEYSPSKDAVFCLPCFLFNSNPTSRFGSSAFTNNGFSNWKKVHDGCNCAFLTHMGKDPNSLHNNAQRAYVDLMNQAQHIEVSLDRQTTQQISANRLRLKTSIDVVRWLSFRGCAFRGHDESLGSKNRGNFLELLSLLASYDEKVEDVLKSAPQNASYTSSKIQKEILQIYANRVRNVIREEIGDRKFSIIVDEARDESKKEQMAIILRFVDKQGQVKERFFDIVHVKDTASLTLKNVIFKVLLQHSFDIQNIRGQGYDGASNMRGEFNGLQALILNDCRYAYYVHCFAHRLQLALVAAAREVVEVHQFFKDLSDIVNIASASSKRHDELQKAQAAEISRLVSINELAT